MNGPPRPGQITFYEQLGVASDASTEEIRNAYRALARMLHPDQQTDANLKRIAEQQMRRLNPIYTVLSDPVRRRQYDEDLAEAYSPAIVMEGPFGSGVSRLRSRAIWVGALLLGGGLIYWLAAGGSGNLFVSDRFNSDRGDGRPTIPIFIPTTQAPPTRGTDSPSTEAEIAALKSQIKTVTAERDFAMRELLRQKTPGPAPRQPPPPAAPSMESTITELPSSPAAPAIHAEAPSARPLPARPAAKPTLAGFWFYAAPKDTQKGKTQPLYLPEYIETTIVEENGVVKGKYRSRFQVVDRAAYPEVNFTFTGTPNGATLTCPWVGQGGARGELTMKMTSDNSLRLDWAASELGSQMGLASGTAILTRRID